MKFDQDLQPAFFLRRYKRFLADVELPDGRVITVHCPNTGSMRGCIAPGCEVMLSRSDNPTRKYPYSFEISRVDGTWIGINTAKTNHLVREAIENGIVTEIGPVDLIKPEIRTAVGSRLDFLLRQGTKEIYMEVKNCTLVENAVAMFPDAVTARGTRHLQELMRLRQEGHGAVIFFCVQRQDGLSFSPAGHIDPLYARTLREAVKQGVQVLAYAARVQPPHCIEIHKPLPVLLPE